NQHESHTVTKNGEKMFIRPIRPEDAPLFVDLFNSLSPQSVYYRFFSPISHLRHNVVARFTQIDYDREIALAAIYESPSAEGKERCEKISGVARVITEPDGKRAEFSVLVSDSWQGKGIGAALLERCLKIAREDSAVEKVWGLVLSENRHMLALGRKAGFTVEKQPDSNDFLLSLEFQKS
ncbi:MAG TPA: N-acetyltransferase, partial [Desulfobacterales bacterium]|nr:N-acetyltransferase [Desulfobacterales bacterium]